MEPSDRKLFRELLAGVHAFYRQDLSEFALGVWWEAMRPFGLAAVKDALNRHAVDPDRGQWMPKPADVVRAIGGGSQDAALVAWAQVDRAVRSVGTYASVVFADPAIHRVIADMGGWIALGKVTEDEWPFRAKEFETRYRGLRGRTFEYPRCLPGLEQFENQQRGYRNSHRTVMVGDAAQCRRVLEGGTDRPLLAVTPLQQVARAVAIEELA